MSSSTMTSSSDDAGDGVPVSTAASPLRLANVRDDDDDGFGDDEVKGNKEPERSSTFISEGREYDNHIVTVSPLFSGKHIPQQPAQACTSGGDAMNINVNPGSGDTTAACGRNQQRGRYRNRESFVQSLRDFGVYSITGKRKQNEDAHVLIPSITPTNSHALKASNRDASEKQIDRPGISSVSIDEEKRYQESLDDLGIKQRSSRMSLVPRTEELSNDSPSSTFQLFNNLTTSSAQPPDSLGSCDSGDSESWGRRDSQTSINNSSNNSSSSNSNSNSHNSDSHNGSLSGPPPHSSASSGDPGSSDSLPRSSSRNALTHINTSNNRSTQAAFYGVFDGHGGEECSNYVAANFADTLFDHPSYDTSIEEALRGTYAILEEGWCERAKGLDVSSGAAAGGTTVLTALFVGNVMYLSNLGDSEAVLCRGGKVVHLMSPHNMKQNMSEVTRVTKCGGRIHNGRLGHPVLNPQAYSIAVTRAIGDVMYKDKEYVKDKVSGLIAEPEVKAFPMTVDDDFVILACDGLWDVIDHEKAVNFVLASIRRCNDKGKPVIWQEITQKLVERAYKRGSTDNITVVIISLSGMSKEPSPAKVAPPVSPVAE